jgi:hypothetical protein
MQISVTKRVLYRILKDQLQKDNKDLVDSCMEFIRRNFLPQQFNLNESSMKKLNKIVYDFIFKMRDKIRNHDRHKERFEKNESEWLDQKLTTETFDVSNTISGNENSEEYIVSSAKYINGGIQFQEKNFCLNFALLWFNFYENR